MDGEGAYSVTVDDPDKTTWQHGCAQTLRPLEQPGAPAALVAAHPRGVDIPRFAMVHSAPAHDQAVAGGLRELMQSAIAGAS